jgi:hypothetical protein
MNMAVFIHHQKKVQRRKLVKEMEKDIMLTLPGIM